MTVAIKAPTLSALCARTVLSHKIKLKMRYDAATCGNPFALGGRDS
jgi:hypothetical protein